jgi:leader peptidase (prepilin peptidase)/N-methyltransferase
VIWGALAGLVATPAVAALAHRLQHSTVHLTGPGWGLLTAGCILAGAAVVARPPAAAAVIAVLLAAFLAAAAVDAAEQRLPDLVTIGAGVLGLAALTAVTLTTGAGSPWRALVGGAIFGGWILAGALLVRDGYGLGDVKLAASLGILLGWASWMTLAIGILASQIAITVMLLHGRRRDRQRIALGPAFAAGALAAVILAPV